MVLGAEEGNDPELCSVHRFGLAEHSVGRSERPTSKGHVAHGGVVAPGDPVGSSGRRQPPNMASHSRSERGANT